MAELDDEHALECRQYDNDTSGDLARGKGGDEHASLQVHSSAEPDQPRQEARCATNSSNLTNSTSVSAFDFRSGTVLERAL